MQSDHPTLEDKLNRAVPVKAKATQIMECDAPQTFGIHGDWGAGKTSFLRQLRYHLDGMKEGCNGAAPQDLPGGQYEARAVTIWFDAWRYQHESAPVIALLQEIRRQFGTWAKAKNKAAKLTDVAVRSVLNSLDDIAKLLKLEAVPLNPKGVQEVGERWEKDHLESRLGVDTIQDYLESAVATVLEKLLGASDGRIVVFIDDLDRCSSDAAFRLLEGLKVYLGLRNCVFVLGMNQQLVVDAIAACMPKEMGPADPKLRKHEARVRAEAYLEKLCTNIERMTPPADTRQLLCDWVGPNLALPLKAALSQTQGQPIRCLPPNPRRIKALANVMERWWPAIAPLNGSAEDKLRALLIVAYVYQFHSELFQRWQFNPGFFTHMVNWSTKLWPTNTAGTGAEWPPYFAGLTLPEQTSPAPDDTSPTPQVVARSTYPDPYATDMFWIAPLIRAAGLNESTVQPIIDAVSMSAAPAAAAASAPKSGAPA